MLGLAGTAPALLGQTRAMPGMAMDTSDRASAAAMESMAMPRSGDPHMHMTAMRPPNAADSARAAGLVTTLRAALQKYRDVHVAEADGYRIFAPNVPQHVYHYTNRQNGLRAAFGFDPDKPTSLLYKKTSSGGWELTGAMYTGRPALTEDQLNERVPLSVARWHEHVNWCLPPAGHPERWTDTQNGKPLFGPKSPIATQEACDAAGGRFFPRIFGWMVHADVFASNDPKVIWGDEDHEH
jgi:hypothetical protein